MADSALSISSSASASAWIGFHLGLVVLLAVEFGFSRIGLSKLAPPERQTRQQKNAVAATLLWTAAATTLAGYLYATLGTSAATQFLAGYTLEETLSIDNLFVFLLLFQLFTIPPAFQPRALFWGVLGAILLRGAFIFAGIGLLTRFQWIGDCFAVVLIVAAVRLVLPAKKNSDETPRWLRWITRLHPVSTRTDVFFAREDGVRMLTLLMLSVIAIECTDVVFALDSIPAVLSMTRQPFLAYTSNILAVISLRSLFFLLAAALKRLRFLHFGLAAVLAFAGLKMLLARILEIGPLTSLAVILSLLGVTVVFSLVKPAAPVRD